MMALYWAIIFVVVVLMTVISFRAFRMAFGLPPVLFTEVLEFKNEKRGLAIMVAATLFLYIVALIIALIGGR